jgi:hypothetical protein
MRRCRPAGSSTTTWWAASPAPRSSGSGRGWVCEGLVTANSPHRPFALAWLHLTVLWAFAFAKPLFDVLEDAPDFFVARGNTSGDIVVFALAFALLPPTLLALTELAAARVPVLARSLHLLYVGALCAAFAVQVLDDAVGGPGVLLILIALLLGAGAAWAYARTRVAPSILTVLGPAPVVFLFIFLVTSPVSKLVFPDEGAQAAEAKVSHNAPVVVLVFDEFDSNMLSDARGRIDRSRYPNFAALADDATWYRNATTVNSQTTLAVPAVMSGRRPKPGMLPITEDYPNSLPTALAGSHELNVVETATQLCPTRLCGKRSHDAMAHRLRSLTEDLGIVSLHLVAPARLEHRLPAVDRTFGNFANGGADDSKPAAGKGVGVTVSTLTNRPAQLESMLRGIHPQHGKPTLSFLHIAVPHIPWQYLPDGEEYVNYGPDPGYEDKRWPTDPFPSRLALQRHLLQVGYADRLLGRLLARLREAGLYRRALIVVTADHGVSYRPGEPRRAPDSGNASDIAAVPLLIKYPGRAGRVDDSFVRTIDVVPTIAHALGARLPYAADGRPVDHGGPATGEVEVRGGSSDHVTKLPFGDFVRRRQAGLRRMVGLFGSDDGGRRLYANGPNWDLLGRTVSRLPQAAATGALRLDGAGQLEDFHPRQHLVPSFLSGRITGGVGAGASLAVAVDGTIRAVSQAFADRSDVRMAAIAPAGAFRAGADPGEVFVVSGRGSGRRLAPLTTNRARQYRLAEGGSAVRVGGRTIPVRPRVIQGYVDRVVRDDQGFQLGGWAADVHDRVPAERLLAFSRGRLVAQGEPTTSRLAVAKQLGLSDARCGFEFTVPLSAGKAGDLRVFALGNGSATELPRWKG